jgi:hypothetical protein
LCSLVSYPDEYGTGIGGNLLPLVHINKLYFLTTIDSKENKRFFATAKK